nr:nuclease-related domain-containing protein [Paenibacillus sp. VKM B-2647]
MLTVAYIVYKIVRKPSHEAAYGDEGERSTAHQLRYLGSEYRVLHNRQVRAGGGSQQFDHIVVGPNGVFHIDSKHWSGEVRFTAQGVERSKEGSHQGDPTAQLYRHEHVLKELLRDGGVQADLVGVICFTHPHCELVGSSPAFLTVKVDRLLHAIKTHKPKKPLSAGQVAGIERLIKEHSSVPH